jgi:RecA-family ATPase
MALTATDEERSAANLLGDGFLRRGQGALLPGPTGIGKSSLAMQAAILWALGKPFFSIKPERPLKSLIVQAENDDIDLVEMRDGICAELGLNADEQAAVGCRVFIMTAHERGMELFRRLDPEVERFKADLLILDPLFAYMDGAVKDQEDVSAFLRSMLQPFIVRHKMGALVLHHTNKPPSGREKSTWQAGDFAYAGSGSIEFANWARAVVVLRSIRNSCGFERCRFGGGSLAFVANVLAGNAWTSLTIHRSRKQATSPLPQPHQSAARPCKPASSGVDRYGA